MREYNTHKSHDTAVTREAEEQQGAGAGSSVHDIQHLFIHFLNKPLVDQ